MYSHICSQGKPAPVLADFSPPLSNHVHIGFIGSTANLAANSFMLAIKFG